MTAPGRIQLRRTKGWRKPAGAIVVSRPSLWGNPYDVNRWGRDLAIAMYRNTVHGIWAPSLIDASEPDDTFRVLHGQHEWFINRLGGHPTDIARDVLAGHELACWCPLDVACHGDVLLEIANPVPGREAVDTEAGAA